jgi:hypothetical protein
LIDDEHILIWVISEKSDKFSSVKEQALNLMWDGINWEKGVNILLTNNL